VDVIVIKSSLAGEGWVRRNKTVLFFKMLLLTKQNDIKFSLPKPSPIGEG